MSMPQLCKHNLSSAISTLCVYTAVCKYFLICAPQTKHADKGTVCNGVSYLKRGWCEQLPSETRETPPRTALGACSERALELAGPALSSGRG